MARLGGAGDRSQGAERTLAATRMVLCPAREGPLTSASAARGGGVGGGGGSGASEAAGSGEPSRVMPMRMICRMGDALELGHSRPDQLDSYQHIIGIGGDLPLASDCVLEGGAYPLTKPVDEHSLSAPSQRRSSQSN
jgi:hypothetical protein